MVERASSISWESPRPSHARSRPHGHGLPNQLQCFSDICDQTFIMPLFNYTKGRYYLLRKWRVAFQNSFPICTASYHTRYELHIHASPSSSHAQENFAQVCKRAHVLACYEMSSLRKLFNLEMRERKTSFQISVNVHSLHPT